VIVDKISAVDDVGLLLFSKQIQSGKFVKDSFGRNFNANEAKELRTLSVAMNDHAVVAVRKARIAVHVSRASDE
jgi:hypothetical protein